MKQRQKIARWNSVTQLQRVLAKWVGVYTPGNQQAGLPALVAASAEPDRLAGQIEQTARQQQTRNGASLEKAAALQALGDAAYRVASAVQACASASGNLARGTGRFRPG